LAHPFYHPFYISARILLALLLLAQSADAQPRFSNGAPLNRAAWSVLLAQESREQQKMGAFGGKASKPLFDTDMGVPLNSAAWGVALMQQSSSC
jgi:hypothetical protein